MEATSPRPLNIIIVGAGIAGLTAAIGLRKAGHHVRIFEKSKFANEVGAALTLSGNLESSFAKLGLVPEHFRANKENFRCMLSKDGHPFLEQDTSNTGGTMVHRVDFHEALKEAAINSGVQIQLSSHIVSLEPLAASITLSTGETHAADVVLGADGVRSMVRNFVVPSAPEAIPFHRSVLRAMVPCDTLAGDPLTQIFLEPPGRVTVYAADDGRRAIIYPCRSNTIMNVGAFYPSILSRAFTNSDDVKKHWLEIFADFHPSLRALLEALEDATPWSLFDLPALSNWSRCRTAIIGDAAHPMLPYSAQGAAQAIEDAVTLSVLLGRGTKAEDVQDRLDLYFSIRHERTEYVQDFARAADGMTPGLAGTDVTSHVAESFATIYNHDAWEYAEEKLREHLGR